MPVIRAVLVRVAIKGGIKTPDDNQAQHRCLKSQWTRAALNRLDCDVKHLKIGIVVPTLARIGTTGMGSLLLNGGGGWGGEFEQLFEQRRLQIHLSPHSDAFETTNHCLSSSLLILKPIN